MPELSGFGTILLFIIGGFVFVLLSVGFAMLVRPNRPNVEKLTTYECGEDPSTSAWGKFNVRFYIVALIFLLFEVELVFLFPWATVFGQKELVDATGGLWGWFALGEMTIFVLILALGLVFAWAKGYLEWERPVVEATRMDSKVPNELYDAVSKTVKEARSVTRVIKEETV
ncbi:NADH-quinone oxidoreductase subunit A [Imperialibacter roseus]|uniref:NADH-quinone oxidoreductase subunit A n=1 Tax=Imperialibacter roseus TaxID=1324217 RepID=A0ABZ0INI2_9BACT|nr:NADH-quinone oxidoreductase subunit A [Imperialibacter roseus]WOK05729.1 NADH-quinone oxidoreductase subunit A [Imperialibacter roseus]